MAVPIAQRMIRAVFGDLPDGRLFIQHGVVWRKRGLNDAFRIWPEPESSKELSLRFARWEPVLVMAR